MIKLFALPAALLTSLLGWMQPPPSIPASHQGLCRMERAGAVEIILCTVSLERHDILLRALDDAGKPYETFARAQASLGGRPAHLIMNAGMYHEDRRPVGLAVQDGRTLHESVLGTGSGNFSLRPNGVFFVENGRAGIEETERYGANGHRPETATQSGPMLLIGGDIHPRFIRGSDSLYVRNGVSVSQDGKTVTLAMTRQPINFYDFAVFFRDTVGAKDALFFDGQVSSLYYPAAQIDYRRDRLGPMLVVTDRP